MSAVLDVAPFESFQPFKMPEKDKHLDDPRYVFTVANFITSDAARDRKWLRAGGIELWNPCLKASRNFIRRGRITPVMLDSLTPVPAEEVDTANTAFFTPEGPNGPDIPNYIGPLIGGGVLMGYPAHPGQQMAFILDGPENVDEKGRRGIVEIEEFSGYQYQFKESKHGGYYDPEVWELEKKIFPEYPLLPVLLDEMAELIQTATRVKGPVGRVASQMYVSYEEFKPWALSTIEEIHQNQSQAQAKGYVFPYEKIHLVLLEQLGLPATDLHHKIMSAPPSQPLTAESLIEAFKAGRDEDRKSLMDAISQMFHMMKAEEKKAAKE